MKDLQRRLEEMEQRLAALESLRASGSDRFPIHDTITSFLEYGKAVADWTTGLTVTLTPCSVAGVLTGEANVVCQIFAPARGNVSSVQVKAGDICPFLRFAAQNAGVLVNVNFSTTGSSDEGVGNRRFQVHQMITNTTAGWDWVRAHE